MTLIDRQTVAQSISWSGLGLHSGDPVSVTVHPGHDGIAFRAGAERIAAQPENVTDTSRCTILGPVSTIEHLMSALAACEVTDAEIEVVGGELPALDGSAVQYFTDLQATSFQKVGEVEIPDLFTRIFLQEDNGLKVAVAKGAGHWRYAYDLGDRWPGRQEFEASDVVAEYGSQVAPARTLVPVLPWVNVVPEPPITPAPDSERIAVPLVVTFEPVNEPVRLRTPPLTVVAPV